MPIAQYANRQMENGDGGEEVKNNERASRQPGTVKANKMMMLELMTRDGVLNLLIFHSFFWKTL